MTFSSCAAAFLALNSSRWDLNQVERFQSRRLRFLVRHAAERVPFYRHHFLGHGVRPADVRGLQDLARLPFALRPEMQQRPALDLIAKGFDPAHLIEHRTSGSTGMPFTIRRSWFEERLLHAFRFQVLLQLGLRWTDLRARTTVGEPFDRPVLSQKHLNCLAPARDLLDQLAALEPDVITGFAGTLAWLATEATTADLSRIRPRFIVTGAETLTPSMRRQITENFRVPVYDLYGAHEFNLIARECPQTGLYHVLDSSVILEVLKDGRPAAVGESGEVYATALHSLAMPFLRYRLGDLAVRGPTPCPCGAQCSTLQSILGRSVDMFVMPDGTMFHPYKLVIPLTHNSLWVRRYQIIQEALDRIRVKVVSESGQAPASEQEAALLNQLCAEVPRGVAITLEHVTDLPPASNGKFRPYYSLVNGNGETASNR